MARMALRCASVSLPAAKAKHRITSRRGTTGRGGTEVKSLGGAARGRRACVLGSYTPRWGYSCAQCALSAGVGATAQLLGASQCSAVQRYSQRDPLRLVHEVAVHFVRGGLRHRAGLAGEHASVLGHAGGRACGRHSSTFTAGRTSMATRYGRQQHKAQMKSPSRSVPVAAAALARPPPPPPS